MSLTQEEKLSTFYDEDGRAGFVDLVKFLLMPFVFLALLGSPISGITGNYVTTISTFASLAFFTLCGFFVLIPDSERRLRKIVRALRRSFITFIVLFLVYLVINLVYLYSIGQLDSLFSPEFLRLRTFFNFFALNVWSLPMGGSIWFIQSLLYAYVFFFLVEKIKLSKTWFYLIVLILTLAFMLCSGEFAGVLHFSLLGYSYIPGGVVTKAIPFMLIGMFLRKAIDKLAKIPWLVYLGTFFLGIACAAGELYLFSKYGLLVYTGNLIGYAIMALSLVCLAITNPEAKSGFFGNHGRSYARRMYAFCEPCSLFVWALCVSFKPGILSTVKRFQSLICFAICFLVSFLIGWIRYKISTRDQRF